MRDVGVGGWSQKHTYSDLGSLLLCFVTEKLKIKVNIVMASEVYEMQALYIRSIKNPDCEVVKNTSRNLLISE
jgi:hypothetical protein